MKCMSDEDLQIFWKNRQHTYSCQKCHMSGFLYEEFKSCMLLRYNCGHVECMHCMLQQGETIRCQECNTKYNYNKLVRQIKKNLPFLIQKLYNEIDVGNTRNVDQ